MYRVLILITFLTAIFFYSCSTSKAFDVEDEMMTDNKELTESPNGVFWPSLETTSRKAKKKSENLIPIYYSLFYIPKNNEIHITSIAGVQNVELNIKDAKAPGDVVLNSEFKGVNIYKIFFKNKRSDKLENIIKKKKIRSVSIKNVKVIDDPEVMMKDIISKKIKNILKNKLAQKYIDKDYEVSANFLITKIYNFVYKNTQKTIGFKFDYIFTKLTSRAPNYPANLSSIEDSIDSYMKNGNYKEAARFNEIYKGIAPDKKKYYKNAYNINIKLNDKMAAVLVLIDSIDNIDDLDQNKNDISTLKKLFKKSLKRRTWYKLNKKLNKFYRKFLKNKIDKKKFVENLKNLVIEYSLD